MTLLLLAVLLGSSRPLDAGLKHGLPGKTVTLDVKDEDVRVILKSMQKQCGIKNLIIDPQVEGRSTFVFQSLPCASAFETVFKTMGLRSVTYGKNVVSVLPRNK